MKIADLHCDTIMRFYEGLHLDGMEGGHISTEKLIRGESLVQCFAIFVPPCKTAENKYGIDCTQEEYFELAYKAYLRELELNKDKLLPAYSVSDILENDRNGIMSALLTVEDGVTLDGKIERVDDYFARGVRMVALTWNFENSLGYPQSSDPEKHRLGLKPFGIEAIRRMNEVGIAVDVSHLSEGGFWDVYRNTKKPFIASHSCARALCDVGRNLTDEQLRALGERGGVVGVNFMAGFLHAPTGGAGDNDTSIDDVVRHLRHMANVAGMDAVALGSDYDGMSSTLEWGDCGGNQLLIRGLERAFSPEQVEKICWKNALRVLGDIIG